MKDTTGAPNAGFIVTADLTSIPASEFGTMTGSFDSDGAKTLIPIFEGVG